MSLVVGLIVAASFGSGDFLGGLASRHARMLAVSATAQLCALVGAIVVAVVAGGDPTPAGPRPRCGRRHAQRRRARLPLPGPGDRRAGLVAPVAAVIGAVIPVGWGLATGERPPREAMVGVGLAIVAGGLISLRARRARTARDDRGRHCCWRSQPASASALSFICYGNTSDDVGVLAGARRSVGAVTAVSPRDRWSRARRSALRAAHRACRPSWPACWTWWRRPCCSSRSAKGLSATVAPVAALAPGVHGRATRWWYLHERHRSRQIGRARARARRTRADRGRQHRADRPARGADAHPLPITAVPSASRSSGWARSPSWCCRPTSSATTSRSSACATVDRARLATGGRGRCPDATHDDRARRAADEWTPTWSTCSCPRRRTPTWCARCSRPASTCRCRSPSPATSTVPTACSPRVPAPAQAAGARGLPVLPAARDDEGAPRRGRDRRPGRRCT